MALQEDGDLTALREMLTALGTTYANAAGTVIGVDASLNEVFDQTLNRELLRVTANGPNDTAINIKAGRIVLASGEDFGLVNNRNVVVYAGGTVNFTTGVVTGGGANFTPYTPTGADQFFKYGVVLNDSNLIEVILPTADAATEAAASQPESLPTV